MPGERRWLYLCGANEVHGVKSEEESEAARAFVSFISQQHFCFHPHSKFTVGLIPS